MHVDDGVRDQTRDPTNLVVGGDGAWCTLQLPLSRVIACDAIKSYFDRGLGPPCYGLHTFVSFTLQRRTSIKHSLVLFRN